MTTFQKIVYAMQWRMDKPAPFGAFHLVSLLLVVLLTVFLIVKFRNASDKTVRRILLVAWVALVVLEVYKQISYTLDWRNLPIHWSYQWSSFPFQFCSTPLYVLPLAVFLREGKARRAVMAFLSTFSVFAGLAVMILPQDVFTTLTAINVQTMLHHGLQIALGVFLIAHDRRRTSWRHLAWGVVLFAAFCAAALALNVAVYHAESLPGVRNGFNMFYISPYYDCTLPVLSTVYKVVPYPVFLLIYILGFALISALVYAAERGAIALARRAAKARETAS